MKAVWILAFGLALAGCNSATQPGRGELFMNGSEVAQKDDAICRSYGAKPGTDAYVQCRMANAQQRTTFKTGMAAAFAMIRPRQCMSNPLGTGVVTNCY